MTTTTTTTMMLNIIPLLLAGDEDDDNNTKNPMIGIIGVIVSSIVWGSNFIVCKGYELPPDGIHFAWLMSIGILLMGFLSLLTAPLSPANDYEVLFSPLGLLGGAFWATGNFLTVPIIRCIGLGVGLAIWAGMNMIVAFGVGSIGMDWIPGIPLPREPLKHPSAGICGLLCGVLALCLFANIKQQSTADTTVAEVDNNENNAADPTPDNNDNDVEEQQPTSTTTSTAANNDLSQPLLHHHHSHNLEEFSPLPPLPNGSTHAHTQLATTVEENNNNNNTANGNGGDFLTGNVALGVGMAILAGIFYGFQLVPLSIWNLRISKNGGHIIPNQPIASDMIRSLRFFFSQFTGIFLMSTIGFVAYAAIYTRNKPQLVSPTATLPSILCGMVWAIGCGGAMIATCELGNAVGYVLVLNGSFLINSIWSIVVFHEIQGQRNLKLFFAAFTLIVLSSILISISKA